MIPRLCRAQALRLRPDLNAASPPRAATRLSSSARQFHRSARLHAHRMPELFGERTMLEAGVPNLLSSSAFRIAWTQYNTWLVDKLNELSAGHAVFEHADIKSIVVQAARDPVYARLFNYASMAFNNHFFFEGLAFQPEPKPMPDRLRGMVERDFGSVETLQKEMLAVASSMFGPGFVWLVKVRTKEKPDGYDMTKGWALRVLATYNAGSPLPGAHYRRQPVDMNTQAAPMTGSLSNEEYLRQNVVQNSVGSLGPHARGQLSQTLSAADLEPVLCVNTWEHVWLMDWLVAGKDDFLYAWWDRVNWDIVAYKAGLGTDSRTVAARDQLRQQTFLTS